MSQHTEYCKRYYAKNRVAILLKKKEHGEANPGFYTNRSRAIRANRLKSWEGFIPLEAQCEMCGVDIYFNCKNRLKAIHFDHRHGDKHKFRTPHQFLARCYRTPKTEALWKSFDFGMLCIKCNTRMPTENRIQFIKNAMRYMKMKEPC